MVAPTEQDATDLEALLREKFPDWDEVDYTRVASSVKRKRSRTKKDDNRKKLNQKWEEDGMCSFEDMKPFLVTSNPSQERTRLAKDTAKEYGWTTRKEGKVWYATKEEVVPALYQRFLDGARRGWVDPYHKKHGLTDVQQKDIVALLKANDARAHDNRYRIEE